MLKEVVRAWGLEPEKILTKEALVEPHRTYVTSEEREQAEIRVWGQSLKKLIKKELIESSRPSH